MIAVYNSCTDPYFNLAAEQYLLENTDDDVFMLWRNGPSVIIGKNQNAWAEINTAFTEENNICVARRITGGGAVFHDLGNVNFSFITEASDASRLNFEKFTAPVVSALGKTGVRACLDGRNDIIANGYKISGNAQCVLKSKSGRQMLLHHGTLLFGADMSALAGALKVNGKKIKAKGIKSVRSRVRNITELEGYSGPGRVEDFIDMLFAEISGSAPRGFTEDEKEGIFALRESKFALWEWNFGVSPEFETVRERRFDFGLLTIMLKIRTGKIEEVRLFGDFFGSADLSLLEKLLCGCSFDREAVLDRLGKNADTVGACIAGASPEDIAELMFSNEA